MVKEKTTLVFAYAGEEDVKNHMDEVLDFCESLKAEMGQEAIALEYNGEMFFI